MRNRKMRFTISAYERRVFALVLVAGCVALPLSHSPGVASVSASSPHSGPLPVTKMLYATAAAGAAEDSARVLIAIDLQARTVRVIGDIGIPTDASLAFCRPGGVPYTITNIFLPTTQSSRPPRHAYTRIANRKVNPADGSDSFDNLSTIRRPKANHGEGEDME
jgi:hypothetical protein